MSKYQLHYICIIIVLQYVTCYVKIGILVIFIFIENIISDGQYDTIHCTSILHVREMSGIE